METFEADCNACASRQAVLQRGQQVLVDRRHWLTGLAPSIEIVFEPDGDGTMMHFRHSGFETENAAAMHGQGWESTWRCLDTFIAEGGLG